MNDDRDDPLLDACLDEVLGGCRPPDLAHQILQRYHGHTPAAELPHSVVAPHVTPVRRTTARPARTRWFGAVLAGSVIACGATWGLWSLTSKPPSLVRAPAPVADSRADSGKAAVLLERPESPSEAKSQAAATAAPAEPVLPPSSVAQVPFDGNPSLQAFAPALPEPMNDEQVVSLIDRHLARSWEEAGAQPSPAIDDPEWCRRLYRMLLDREAEQTEVARFLEGDPATRRVRLVDQLLNEPSSARQLAVHWAGVLVGPAAPPDARQALQEYLQQTLHTAGSLDAIAQGVLTATGDLQQTGAAAFLLTHYGPRAERATAEAARVFLGQQLVCAQCHDHPLQAEPNQREFWELNAFFRQLSVQSSSRDRALADVDFRGERAARAGEAAVFYETPDGQVKAAFPRLDARVDVPRSGEVSQVRRRELLASLLVQSPNFRRAMANRMWSYVFGYGLVSSPHETADEEPVAAAELLRELGDQLAAHDFQWRPVLRWLVLSQAFERSQSSSAGNEVDLPELGSTALFSRFYERAAGGAPVREALAALNSTQSDYRSAATTARMAPLSNAPEALLRSAPAGISAGMAPDPRFARSFHVGPNRLVRSILESDLDGEQQVEHLFLAVLQRPPSRDELRLARDVLNLHRDTPQQAMLDIWWALLQSDEFAVRR